MSDSFTTPINRVTQILDRLSQGSYLIPRRLQGLIFSHRGGESKFSQTAMQCSSSQATRRHQNWLSVKCVRTIRRTAVAVLMRIREANQMLCAAATLCDSPTSHNTLRFEPCDFPLIVHDDYCLLVVHARLITLQVLGPLP